MCEHEVVAERSGVTDWLLSALVAVLLAALGVAAGLAPHRQHDRAGAAEQRQLVAAAGAIRGTTVVSSEHHTVGYADRLETCAAEASVRLRTPASPAAVLQALGASRLAHVEVDPVAGHLLRARAYRTFGLNPFDWSCWQ